MFFSAKKPLVWFYLIIYLILLPFYNHAQVLNYSSQYIQLTSSEIISRNEIATKKNSKNVTIQSKNKQTASTINSKSILPDIVYDYQALLDVVNEISMSLQAKEKAILYLKNIEQKIGDIKRYQSKGHIEHFFHSMKEAIYDIHNTARALYELTKPYHPILSNTLRKLILDSTTLFEVELNKSIEMPVEEKEALNLKTRRLYAEQSYVVRQQELQKKLIAHLTQIKQLLTEADKPSSYCYISYAWPSKENYEQEYWVQPFLSVLYDHLTAAGIRVIMDIRDNKPGDSIYKFMEQYHDGNYIILIGTESLLKKHYSTTHHTTQTELSIISDRFEQDQKQFGYSRIYPLLISGSMKASFPEIYDKYHRVRDAREMGYLLMLEQLVDWIYEQPIMKAGAAYTRLWYTFHKNYQGLPRNADTHLIDQEVNVGYHLQKIDYSKQTTVNEGNNSVVRVSRSISKHKEDAKQFQRPSITPDFVKRQGLWDKIINYFNQHNQQVLILIAHGLGGTGKTELAKYYYLHPPRVYALRAWFNAESKEQLYAQYVDLAKANGVEFSRGTPIEEQVNQIKKWLESQENYLLVYDNVPDAKQIEGLLPEQGNHHIVITSRNAVQWPVQHRLDISVMEEQEAIKLICKITGFQEKNVKLKELVSDLNYLPLALAQAGAYIAEKQTSIEDYLTLYQKYQSLLMNDGTLIRSPKHEPVWVTFNMNFKALAVDCPNALLTLKQTSWLDASVIPEVLFKTMLKDIPGQPKDLLLNVVKKHTGRYSLINFDRKSHQLSIHRLVQDIIRNQQSKVEARKILIRIAASIKSIYPENSNKTMEDIHTVKLLLPHMEKVSSYLKQYFNNNEYANFSLEFNLGDAYETIGNYTKAKEHFHCDLLIKQKKRHQNNQVDIANILCRLGDIDNELGNHEESKKSLKNALEIKEKALGTDHIEVANILDQLGWVHIYVGDYIAARPLLKRSLLIKGKYCPNSTKIVNTLIALGWTYNFFGEFAKAESLAKLALSICETHLGPNHIETSIALHLVGRTYLHLKLFMKAQEFFARALEIRNAHYGMEHILTANVLVSYGWMNLLLGDYQKAKEFFEGGLSIYEKYFGNDQFETVHILNNLATCFFYLRNINKSIELHERALTVYKNILSHEHIGILSILNDLGNTFLSLGEYTKSKELFEKALTATTQQYDPQHNFRAIVLANLGNTYRLLGNYSQSKKLLEDSLNLLKDLYKSDNVDIARVMCNLALLYGQLGDTVKQREYLIKGLSILKKHLPKNHPDIMKTSKALEQLNKSSINREKGSLKEIGFPLILIF